MYANHLINWDTETYMPSKGVNSRSKVLADLNLAIQRQLLDKEFLSILKQANQIDKKQLNIYEQKALYYLNKTIDQYLKLPAQFISDWAELIGVTSVVWAEARKNNNYELFEPYLAKIFNMTKKKAGYLGAGNKIYDVIFDTYEDGMTSAELDKYFIELRSFLEEVPIEQLSQRKMIDMEQKPYSLTKMKELNAKVLNFLGHDPNRFRLDVSAHPFSLFLSPHDLRITTRYPKLGFNTALMPTIHEFGHALFASNVDEELEATPLWPDTSYALHESQSRFWENILGRSRGFIKHFIKELRSLNSEFKNFEIDDFYNFLNHVKPSLIRVEADEITYHYHILIRYEIERALLSGEIDTKEAPNYWNKAYEKYLGITPKNFSEGILQDIHWAFGSIGYFPTYSLGSTLSAMWDYKLKKELNIDYEELNPKEIREINGWFKTNIHQYAGMYSLEESSIRVCSEKFSSKRWQEYINKKYL
jgi:carboxypeptidase Taq